jgi:hypothetical protein
MISLQAEDQKIHRLLRLPRFKAVDVKLDLVRDPLTGVVYVALLVLCFVY